MKELTEILHKVQKPGRYIGEEINMVRKDHSGCNVSIALAYPDTYEIGMSYLGLRILYHLLNEIDDVVCERVFAPWIDMEHELVNSGRKIFGLESKREINGFDIVGFSLSYELTYANVLNMLHLGGITLVSGERKDSEPLVIAGGACCYNPEPMSKFIDIFFIGDAEDTIVEFIERYRDMKKKGFKRKEILREAGSIKGLYVPSLYEAEYKNGIFRALIPREENIPLNIQKGTVKDLNEAYYPVKQIVPLVKIVHDRIMVEIMRGCPNKCRFCQARAINGPVRFRKPEVVRNLCKETYRNTGYSEISFLSLSSINYPYLLDLIKGVTDDMKGLGVGVSVPSLRVDESFYDLPEIISSIHKAGLTFAPETADNELQEAIGKNIDHNVLCRSAMEAYKHGWKRVKLYFMIGFPGSHKHEIESIVKNSFDISRLRKKYFKSAAEVKVSVNAFIPKPHTPFQWLGFGDIEQLGVEGGLLKQNSTKKVKFEFHDIKKSIVEACLSRGDRRVGDVILEAWRSGAKMDSWSEFFHYDLWENAFRANGMDINYEARKTFPLSGIFPWGHIGSGEDIIHLREELVKSGLSRSLS